MVQRVTTGWMEERVASVLADELDGLGVVGVAWLVDGEEEIQRRWSPASLAEEPRFLAYSLTKTVIATLYLALQEVGRVHVDAPLSDWRPDLPEAKNISLRRMLNHSSGYPDYGRIPRYSADLARDPKHPWSSETYLDETLRKGVVFEPGSDWSYSNPSYMVLREILEQVTAMSLKELVDYWIVRKLGLRRTSVVETIAELSDLTPASSSQLSEDGERRDVREHYHPGWVSHGLVASTPSEMVRFYDALRGETILTHTSREEMETALDVPDTSVAYGRPMYGLGLMVDPEGEWGRFTGHGGEGPGYTAFAARHGGIGVTICVMGAEDGPGRIGADRVMRTILG